MKARAFIRGGWQQIIRAGKYETAAGPLTLTVGDFAGMVDRFADKPAGIPIDVNFASHKDPPRGRIPLAGVPAVGWVRGLRITGQGLWAFVEWLPGWDLPTPQRMAYRKAAQPPAKASDRLRLHLSPAFRLWNQGWFKANPAERKKIVRLLSLSLTHHEPLKRAADR